ncbi:hypothetical protein NLI96_g6564 [Meripilus lineatus]|uniref:Uncharacterized protein n=1 Tax=Meripilus lineatus TaxID=2056292 RepID=A0AAD5YCU7_9APHY|nr:hypothetical protein NLI96_g6564 [Physisporinus lineatus]
MSSKSRPSLQSATDFSALQYGDDSNDADTAKLYQHYISQMPDEAPLSDTPQDGPSELPPPVTQPQASPSSQTRRSRAKKNVRVALNIRNHWEKFIRRFGAGSAPSTSSNLEDTTSESITFTRRPQDNPSAPEDPDELLDAVIVDREWSNDIKTASSHSEQWCQPTISREVINSPAPTQTMRVSLYIRMAFGANTAR